ncbi:hypothetical protein C8R46DRAFT_1101692 [Mycena filopes]|nr:hypothetical protein C8R46DRAFT_1101692 [Mycena filopes]
MSVPPPPSQTLLVRFDTRHAQAHAAYLQTEGISSGLRYKAIDSKAPTWIALYETVSPDLPPPPPVDAEVEGGSMASRLERNSYTLSYSRTHPNTRAASIPADILYLLHVDLLPAREDAFTAWYDSEQTDAFTEVPGWLRVRRYRLHSHDSAGAARTVPPRRYLMLHEFNNPEFAETPEYARLAMGSERVREMTQALAGIELRVFELQR